MNRTIAFCLAALLATSAQAVTISIDMTAGEISRFAAALGKASNLKTPDTPAVVVNGVVQTPMIPGVPRNASNAEMKAFVIDSVRDLVRSQEDTAAIKAAVDAAVKPTPVDPK